MRNPIGRPQIGHPWKSSAARARPYVPLPFTPEPRAYPVLPKAALVRPYVLDSERRRWRECADRTRLGLAVLLDMARPLELAL
ncbi:hypothetical protein Nans01_14630 [Nocardiopsis ansamitocini]|uniref:Uncharacterized protein n=1 Tax=Nocardiopsis ansamitocini TaxID=1670832 RepID=A0A9W6P4T8_9ACTN|nr:hypothetical protein Nans01_14630 [Nocardiopsis ansamitocini]